MGTSNWTACTAALPPENEIVETMIDERGLIRNAQRLQRKGKLWFTPDGGMYVYYTPTHWKRCSP